MILDRVEVPSLTLPAALLAQVPRLFALLRPAWQDEENGVDDEAAVVAWGLGMVDGSAVLFYEGEGNQTVFARDMESVACRWAILADADVVWCDGVPNLT